MPLFLAGASFFGLIDMTSMHMDQEPIYKGMQVNADR